MVEAKLDPETGIRRQRVDTYTPELGDVMFRGRAGGVSGSGLDGGSEPRRHDRQVYRRPGNGVLGSDLYSARRAMMEFLLSDRGFN